MDKILIINLKGPDDFYSCANLTGSLAQRNSGAQIEILVYKDLEPHAQTIKHINKVHVIDRDRIELLIKNDLFSNGMALNTLLENLTKIKETKWDQVINYDNNDVSNCLSSYILQNNQSCSFTGSKISENNSIIHSDQLSFIYHEVLKKFHSGPLHFNDLLHLSCGVDPIFNQEKILVPSKSYEVARKNIETLRQKHSCREICVRIVGIQFKGDKRENNIPLCALMEFINVLLENPHFHPLLIISPNEEERIYAREINKQFDNSLVIVEAECLALTSVISNVDILVTPDGTVKHLGDLLNVPVIEVHRDSPGLFRHGTIGAGNMIITQTADKKGSLTGEDIFCALRCYYNREYVGHVQLSTGVALYRVCHDQIGIYYSHIAGDASIPDEITRMVSRNYLAMFLNLENYSDRTNEILRYPASELKEWIRKEKDLITNLTREMLGAFRSLIGTKNNNNPKKDFVKYLEKILQYCETKSLVAIPAVNFCSQMESLPRMPFEDTYKHTESLLYNFKMNIQKIVICIQCLEKEWSLLQEEMMTERRRINANI